ncbi:MAG: hypothetical protein O2783_03595 [Chloroflexi bacterium]|nr:hypothetical protein [Chloroflexota bacterium]
MESKIVTIAGDLTLSPSNARMEETRGPTAITSKGDNRENGSPKLNVTLLVNFD